MAVLVSREAGLAAFADCKTVVLTTFRRNGTPVDTAVHIAVDRDRAFIRSPGSAGKIRRLRHNPSAVVTRSVMADQPAVMGLLRSARALEPEGPGVAVKARILEGAEYARAARLLARKYPILHGFLIPLSHRLMRTQTINVELTPVS
jgi:uncharacterized protein